MNRRLHAPRQPVDDDDDRGRDRWLVSYADFITLLFAFFVVMYSISSVNTGKFRVLSDSLETVLAKPVERAVPIDMGGGAPPHDGILDGGRNLSAVDEAAKAARVQKLVPDIVAPTTQLVGTPRERLEAAAGALGGRDDVKIRETENWLIVELGSEVLFTSGSATLNPAAEPGLARIAAVVADMGHPVRVEGFTDNLVIRGGPFGSNWGLSAARAATIADRLVFSRVLPQRVSATGYGEYRPIADNATPEGRRRNRRVVIAVAKNDQASLDAEASAAEEASEETSNPPSAQSLQRIEELPGPAEIGQ